jgi:hypothetical protein
MNIKNSFKSNKLVKSLAKLIHQHKSKQYDYKSFALVIDEDLDQLLKRKQISLKAQAKRRSKEFFKSKFLKKQPGMARLSRKSMLTIPDKKFGQSSIYLNDYACVFSDAESLAINLKSSNFTQNTIISALSNEFK